MKKEQECTIRNPFQTSIPPVRQSTFQARLRKVGPATEEVAKASCKQAMVAMEVEKECWKETE